jgi:oxygen-independent coproporphyrinogen-3 oxidase
LVKEVSLYFHIPFCSKKCPYCHFFVIPDNPAFKEPFLDALIAEWRLRLPQIQDKEIVSIYFGGGTPSKLSPTHYERLLSEIQNTAPQCEITLEANPEDITLPLMQAYKAAGINRVSIGVQSLEEEELLTLGRSHGRNRALEAIHATHAAGIPNLSIDLMFELPGQTKKSWRRTLEALRDLPCQHLSLYNLTIEPHTQFFKQRATLQERLPTEEARLEMLQEAVSFLEKIGLHRYEISAFARHGQISRHNSGYWTGRPFLGFGPSAFSYWDKARFSNIAHFQLYLEAIAKGILPVAFHEALTQEAHFKEMLSVQLRLMAGVNLEAFQKKYGHMPEETGEALRQLMGQGWLVGGKDQICLTEDGRLFYDSVAVELI